MIQEDVRELDHLDHAAVARIKNFVKVQVRVHLSTFPVKKILIRKVSETNTLNETGIWYVWFHYTA